MQDTVISVTGPTEGKHLSLILPWDANLEDWVTAFKTILTHQTFGAESIREIFADEDYPLYTEPEYELTDLAESILDNTQDRPSHPDRTYSRPSLGSETYQYL